MKAWRWYAFGDMRLDEVPQPEAKPGWVVAKIKIVQASVTEAQCAIGLPTNETETTRKLIEQKAPIRLFGHELCAEIVEVGKGVESLKVGDRVVARGKVPCYNCELCRTGHDLVEGPDGIGAECVRIDVA